MKLKLPAIRLDDEIETLVAPITAAGYKPEVFVLNSTDAEGRPKIQCNLLFRKIKQIGCSYEVNAEIVIAHIGGKTQYWCRNRRNDMPFVGGYHDYDVVHTVDDALALLEPQYKEAVAIMQATVAKWRAEGRARAEAEIAACD